ncbi:MAG: hypothetical protein F6K08_28505, partial [Okeania sp. SIO1H6]|nr:hypothetical protein [Okeania sp. SIO1H6]
MKQSTTIRRLYLTNLENLEFVLHYSHNNIPNHIHTCFARPIDGNWNIFTNGDKLLHDRDLRIRYEKLGFEIAIRSGLLRKPC